MVSIVRIDGQIESRNAELYGLSTDEKPIKDIPNASVFYCMDTQALFLFDEENGVWIEQ